MKHWINREWIFTPYLLVAAVAVTRVAIHHSHNFVPVFTSLLFFAVTRPRREYAIPFSLLTGIDIYLTRFRYGYPLTGDHVVTWLWYLAALMAGAMLFQGKSLAPRAMVCSLLASMSFFVVSNFAVWAEWGMYARTWRGVGACYVAALPFFRNSLASEMAASAMLFALVHSVRRWREGCLAQAACPLISMGTR